MPLKFLVVVCPIFVVFFNRQASGHGYMIKPVNRASIWRIDWREPPNFNDNEYFCGGSHVQYYLNNGKCGPCGDDWRDPVPRSNENGGFFGKGIILSNYNAGAVMEVHSLITANHLGSLYFSLCKLDHPDQPETEECFEPLKMADSTPNHPINALDYEVTSYVKLPDNFTCERCVLRWHYRTGNSWGVCQDGTQNMGCGNQEIFRNCADISIHGDHKAEQIVPADENKNPQCPPDPTKKPEAPEISNFLPKEPSPFDFDPKVPQSKQPQWLFLTKLLNNSHRLL